MEKIRYRLVYNRKNKLNAQGAALIQLEASLHQRKVYFTTRIYVRPSEWDKKTSSIVNHPQSLDLNSWLYDFILSMQSTELSLWKRGIIPTLLQLKEAVKDDRRGDITFDSFSRRAVIKSTRSERTKGNLIGTLSVLSEYRPGYDWDDLTYTFLKEFEIWLLNKGAAVNTVAKHLRNVRTFIGEAMSAGYLSADANPFKNFKIKHERVPHRFLNPDDLRKMESVKVDGKLAHVRDAFLFCCYTGLRFSDFKHLKDEHFLKQKGQTWLVIKTQKTGYDVKIPLSLAFDGRALEVLQRYPSVSAFSKIGCNADTNRHLATLQKLAKIKMRTTFHTARHSYLSFSLRTNDLQN